MSGRRILMMASEGSRSPHHSTPISLHRASKIRRKHEPVASGDVKERFSKGGRELLMATHSGLLISLVAWGCLASPAMAADEPKATTQVVTCGKATLIDLEAKDKPVADVLDEIAKKMGYEKIVDPENATPGLNCSCSFKKKPAWECLVEICEKNGLVFGGAGIGQDFALGIYKPGTRSEER